MFTGPTLGHLVVKFINEWALCKVVGLGLLLKLNFILAYFNDIHNFGQKTLNPLQSFSPVSEL